MKREYGLHSDSTKYAIEHGLASAEWYHTDVPRAKMKQLMQRSDGPAIRDTLLWLFLLAASLAGGVYFWGSWWCVPFFFVYGTLYGSGSDARWHEMGHGTAFKTAWMNKVIYQIACFMLILRAMCVLLNTRRRRRWSGRRRSVAARPWPA